MSSSFRRPLQAGKSYCACPALPCVKAFNFGESSGQPSVEIFGGYNAPDRWHFHWVSGKKSGASAACSCIRAPLRCIKVPNDQTRPSTIISPHLGTEWACGGVTGGPALAIRPTDNKGQDGAAFSRTQPTPDARLLLSSPKSIAGVRGGDRACTRASKLIQFRAKPETYRYRCLPVDHTPSCHLKAKPVFSAHLMQNESPQKTESGLGVVRQSDTMAGLHPSKLQTNLSWQRQCPAEEPTDQRGRLLRPQSASSASSVPLQRVQLDSAAQWILSRVLVLMGPGGTS